MNASADPPDEIERVDEVPEYDGSKPTGSDREAPVSAGDEGANRKLQRKITWTRLVAFGSGAVAILSLAANVFMWRAMVEANAISASAVAFSKRSTVAERRACLVVDQPLLTVPPNDKLHFIQAHVKIKNACSGVARDVRSNSRVRVLRSEKEAIAELRRLRDPDGGTTVLVPNDSFGVYRERPVTPADLDDVFAGRARIYAFGRILYSDDLGVRRETQYCYYHLRVRPDTWQQCESGGNTESVTEPQR